MLYDCRRSDEERTLIDVHTLSPMLANGATELYETWWARRCNAHRIDEVWSFV